MLLISPLLSMVSATSLIPKLKPTRDVRGSAIGAKTENIREEGASGAHGDAVSPAAQVDRTKDTSKLDFFRGKFSPASGLRVAKGQVSSFSFSVSPVVEVSDVKVEIIVPNVLVELISGEREWLGQLDRGSNLTLSFLIKPRVETYLSIAAHVEGVANIRGGTKVENTYYLTLQTSSPAAILRIENRTEVSGQFVAIPSNMTSPSSNLGSVTLQSPGASITFHATFFYVNENGGFSPMRWVTVSVMDDDLGPDELVADCATDGNGQLRNLAQTGDCVVNNDDGWLQDGRDPYLKVSAHNEAAWGKNGDGDPYYLETGKCGDDLADGSVCNFGSLAPTAFNEIWQAVDAAATELSFLKTLVGFYFPTVTIRWPHEHWPSYSYDNVIHLPDKQDPNCAPDCWNHLTVFHEYGHASMYWGYEKSMPPHGVYVDHHFIFSETDPGFALVEGWAEFMEVVIENNPNNIWGWCAHDSSNNLVWDPKLADHWHGGANAETSDWYNCVDEIPGDFDGGSVEGSTVMILWDIWDGPGPGDDDLLMLGTSWGIGFQAVWYLIMGYNIGNMGTDFWNLFLASYVYPNPALTEIYYWAGIDHNNPPTIAAISYGGSYSYDGWYARTMRLCATPSDFDGWVDPGRGGDVTFFYATTDPYHPLSPPPLPIGSGTLQLWPSPEVGQWCLDWDTTTAFPDAADDSVWVVVLVRDNLGALGIAISGPFGLDNARPPTPWVSATPGWTYEPWVWWQDVSDVGSGVNHYQVSIGGRYWTSLPPIAMSIQVCTPSIPCIGGSHTVYVRAVDHVGNVGYAGSTSILYDATPPVTSIVHSKGSWMVALAATDSESGVSGSLYSIPDAHSGWFSYSGPFGLPGYPGPHGMEYTVEAYSIDNAGNQESPPKTETFVFLAIRVDPSGGGTTNPEAGIAGTGYWYDKCYQLPCWPSRQVVTATANPGYIFDHWDLDGVNVGSSSSYTVTMWGPLTLTAVFRLTTLPVSSAGTDIVNAPTYAVHYVLPDWQTGSGHAKPPGVGTAALSDFTALGFMYGASVNTQEMVLDTNVDHFDPATGAPKLSNSVLVLFGGRGVNAVVHYYEMTEQTSRVYAGYINLGGIGTYACWDRYGNMVASLPASAGQAGTSDLFLVEYFRDAHNNKVFIIYGFAWKGTYAGGVFFRTYILPNIGGFSYSWYIYRWDDDNGNGLPDPYEVDTAPVSFGD